MKVTLTIPTFLSGGMERVMCELANYWSNNNITVDIIFLVKHKPFYKISENVNSISMPNFGYEKNIFSKFIYKIRLLFYLRKKYKTLNSDNILSFGEGYNSFVLLSTLGLNIDVFVSNRSNPLKKLPFSIELLQKHLYPYAKGIIVQTSLAKDVIEQKTGHKNAILMPNPVKIIPQTEATKENIILNIGRLVPEKDQLTLIKIFDEINRKDWFLHIIGDGPLRGKLEHEIKTRNLEDNVKLLGAKRELSHYMSQSKIFAFSSISEGFPNALCEAMVFPIPCISFDCNAGPRDVIINEENGFLIEQNNIELYKEKLLMLMESEQLRDKLILKSVDLRNDLSLKGISEILISEFKA